MSDQITRPQADGKKIHSRDEFELCYIRHKYFRKTTDNPTASEMKPYLPIVKHMAKNTFFTYRNLFHVVGFESEDLINIGQIHLVSFLGLFSMEKLPEKYDAFKNLFVERYMENPEEQDILNKNKANFTLFLKQRMEDVVRICRQKARNIKGLPTEEYQVFYGLKRPPKILRHLSENHEKYGFKKLDLAVFKSIRKRAKAHEQPIFRFDGTWYVCVPHEQKSLSIVDFSGADLDPYDNIHNMTPEQVLFSLEEKDYWATKQIEFNKKSKRKKISMIKSFINKNKNSPKFIEEIKAARKLLKEIEP